MPLFWIVITWIFGLPISSPLALWDRNLSAICLIMGRSGASCLFTLKCFNSYHLLHHNHLSLSPFLSLSDTPADSVTNRKVWAEWLSEIFLLCERTFVECHGIVASCPWETGETVAFSIGLLPLHPAYRSEFLAPSYIAQHWSNILIFYI